MTDQTLGSNAKSEIQRAIDYAIAHGSGGSVPDPITSNVEAPEFVSVGGAPVLRLIDLGVVNAVDLLDGPQTLYTPSVGQYFHLEVGPENEFEPIDGGCPFFVQTADRILPNEFVDPPFFLTVSPSDLDEYTGFFPTGRRSQPTMQNGSPIKIVLVGGTNDYPILNTLSAWQSGHIYALGDQILEADHVWSASGGTSDVSEPDWASNLGGTVVDNDITWTDEGAIPTQGSIHLYAVVS